MGREYCDKSAKDPTYHGIRAENHKLYEVRKGRGNSKWRVEYKNGKNIWVPYKQDQYSRSGGNFCAIL